MVGFSVAIKTKHSEWHNVVNIQRLAILLLMHTASLAGVAIPLARFSALFAPVRSAIFRCAWNNLRQSETASRAKFAAVLLDAGSTSYESFTAHFAGAVNRVVAAVTLAAPKCLVAFATAKSMIARCLRWGPRKMFATPMTREFHLIALQFATTDARARRFFNASNMGRGTFKLLATHGAYSFARLSPMRSPALSGTKMNFTGLRRLYAKALPAMAAQLVKRLVLLPLAIFHGARLAPRRPICDQRSAVSTSPTLAVVETGIEGHGGLQCKTSFAGPTDVLAEGTRLTPGKGRKNKHIVLSDVRQFRFPQHWQLYHEQAFCSRVNHG